MKKELKSMLVGLFVLLLYLVSEYIYSFTLMIFNINFDTLSTTQKIIFNLSFQFILILTIIFIYRKKFINDLKNLKNCHFTDYIKYWIGAVGLMLISNIIINMFTAIETSTNQEEIINTFSKAPIYTFILTVFFAPVLEELVFRLSFRKMFKTDLLFIIMSGIFFGFMHVTSPSCLAELLYIIPYSIPGWIFAYTLTKSNNIFIPIGLHFIHNSIMMILQTLITLL